MLSREGPLVIVSSLGKSTDTHPPDEGVHYFIQPVLIEHLLFPKRTPFLGLHR